MIDAVNAVIGETPKKPKTPKVLKEEIYSFNIDPHTGQMKDEVEVLISGDNVKLRKKQIVMIEEGKKKMLSDADMDETGFHKAAHAAKKANQSHFEFMGKKYPVTAKSQAEGYVDDIVAKARASGMNAKVVTKADKERDLQAVIDRQKKAKEKAASNPPSTSMIGKGRDSFGPNKGYGQGRYMGDSVEIDDDVLDETTGVTDYNPKSQGGTRKELLAKYSKSGDPKHAEAARKAGATQSELKAASMKKEGTSFKDRLLEAYMDKKDKGDILDMDESEMTDAQMKKREKIVMSMKDGQAGFKKRYGKNWKNVMYATATKQAMKEEVEELDEEHSEKEVKMAIGILNDKRYKGGNLSGAAKAIEKMKPGLSKHPAVKKAMQKANEEYEYMMEKNESHTHAAHYENDKGEWTGMNLLVAKDDEDAIRQAHEKCKEGCRLSRVEKHIPVKEGWEDMMKAVKDRAGPQPSGGSGVKQGSRYGGSKQKEKPEHDEPEDKKVKKEAVDPKVKTVDMLRGRVKKPKDFQDGNEHSSAKIKLAAEEMDETFKGPESGSGVGDNPFITSESKPMKNAKELANSTMKRIKTEMLGKISN
jgi:hypothetical protein